MMKVVVTASDREKARNYVKYLSTLGEVEVVTPLDPYPLEYDLLVLAGGEDLHPKYYGEDVKYPELLEMNEARDRLELTLVGRALRDGKPVFGICRGLQVLTVALGGKLYQDLGKEGFNPYLHQREGKDTYHGIRFYDEFSSILGDSAEVNSNHHQGIKLLPDVPDVTVLAEAEDGLVEAFKVGSLKVLAVQWHPERHKSPISNRLLEYVRSWATSK